MKRRTENKNNINKLLCLEHWAILGSLNAINQSSATWGKNRVLEKRSYKPENQNQPNPSTYKPGTPVVRGKWTTQGRTKAEGQEAGGNLAWNSKSSDFLRLEEKWNDTWRKNQLQQEWELRWTHGITIDIPSVLCLHINLQSPRSSAAHVLLFGFILQMQETELALQYSFLSTVCNYCSAYNRQITIFCIYFRDS